MKRLFAVAALVVVAACGPLRYELKSAEIATGADAVLVANVMSDQGFTRLQFDAENLPPPGRIEAGCTEFVVWQRRSSAEAWTRVGALKYDEGTRKGKLAEVTVPHLAFDFEITAETTPDPASPSAQIIFAQRVEKK